MGCHLPGAKGDAFRYIYFSKLPQDDRHPRYQRTRDVYGGGQDTANNHWQRSRSRTVNQAHDRLEEFPKVDEKEDTKDRKHNDRDTDGLVEEMFKSRVREREREIGRDGGWYRWDWKRRCRPAARQFGFRYRRSTELQTLRLMLLTTAIMQLIDSYIRGRTFRMKIKKDKLDPRTQWWQGYSMEEYNPRHCSQFTPRTHRIHQEC